VPVQDVRRYEAELWENLHANHADIYAGIAGGTPLSDEAKEALKAANTEFAKGFQTTDGSTVVNEPEPEALAEGDLDKHQITVSAKK
jgi:F-type H+-transporting ATPase subunit alpha